MSVPRGAPDAGIAREWGTSCGGVPLRRLHLREDPTDSVIDYLRLRPRADGGFLTVVIPEEFRRASLLDAVRRRSFSLKGRLLREPGVVITDVPVVRHDRHPEEGEAVRIEVIVPIATVNDPTLRALDYALSLGAASVRAIHIALGEAGTATIEEEWDAAKVPIPLEIVSSPYRDIGTPLLEEVRRVTARTGTVCNVVMPEAVILKRRHGLLHNRRAAYIKRLLLFEERTILTSVPYQVD